MKEKYFLFFSKDTNELYAWTNDTRIKKEFLSIRKKELFHMRQLFLSKKDVKHLHEEKAENMLSEYCFNDFITFPITNIEKISIESFGNKTAVISIFGCVNINPKIFNDEVQEILEAIGYKSAYNYYENGKPMYHSIFRADFLSCFIHIFGYTLEM